jgi:hypothetical protein
VEDVTWAALTLTLTLLGAIWTWVAFQRRGVASGLRAAAFTLLPAAAYLTKTLQMFTRIAEAVTDWAASLVFNPFVWAGVVLAGISALLFTASAFLRARELGGSGTRSVEASGKGSGKRGGKALPSGRTPAAGSAGTEPDDDTADIEALLRKHGIT